MIRALTLWLIRRTCLGCGKMTTRNHWHPNCKQEICGADV